MVIYPVRLSFANVFVPVKKKNSDTKQYGVCAMVPKTDKALVKKVMAAQADAMKVGIDKGKFTLPQVKAPTFKKIIHDGDIAYESEMRGPEFKGMYYFSCNRLEVKGAPEVVKRVQGEQMDCTKDEVYSGCWAALDINFYPYKGDESKGIAVGLNNVMLYRRDDLDASRLDGKSVASTAFKDVEGGIDEEAIEGTDAPVEDDNFF